MNLEDRLSLWHRLTQVSFFSLIAVLIIWAFVFPPEKFSAIALALVWVFPLLFPIPGILKKRFYTYAWAQFINMIYFCHAIVFMMTSKEEWIMATIELFIVLLFFTASIVTIQLKKKLTQRDSQ